MLWGTALKCKLGVINGGKYLEHDRGLSRALGYFFEPVIVLCLFAKQNTQIKLQVFPLCLAHIFGWLCDMDALLWEFSVPLHRPLLACLGLQSKRL